MACIINFIMFYDDGYDYYKRARHLFSLIFTTLVNNRSDFMVRQIILERRHVCGKLDIKS